MITDRLRPGELPTTISGWSITPVAAGWWLSDADRQPPAAACALSPERGRPSIVVDASGPDSRTDRLLDSLFLVLPSAGLTRLRLVLSAAADRYAGPAAHTYGIDLITAEDEVVITPLGYAIVRAAGPGTHGELPQWRRCLPTGDRQAAGVLAPSSAWEQGLAADLTTELGHHARLHRVPAGLALGPPRPDTRFVSAARQVWPDPERLSIVVDATASGEEVQEDLAKLLALLSPGHPAGIRLHWPRAGAGTSAAVIQELARRFSVDLFAPAADVSASGFGGMCHGPAGAVPWLQFGRDGTVSALGSLYPVPRWEQALAAVNITGLAAQAACEHIAAGLCVYRPDSLQSGLTTTARSLLPDPARMTIVIGGDAGAEEIRQDTEAVLRQLPAQATRSVRLALAGAGSGDADSYAQFLADAIGGEIIAPTGGWTATPDGRLRAFAARGQTAGPGASDWRAFVPRRAAPSPEPAVARPPVPQQTAAELGGDAGHEASASDTAAPRGAAPAGPGPIPLLARDHRSTAQERMAYRESAAGYDTYSVSVRRILTQRPGLRSVTAGEADDSLITDFTAVLDFLRDDRHALAVTLRSKGTTGDPRMACGLSGLRRLPSFAGAVFTSAPLLADVASGYAVGAFLVEPAFIDASSSPSAGMEGDIEYAIWSQTGKRLAALVAEADRDEIIFAPGTAYRVLRVDMARPAASKMRVFLRECAISRHRGTAGLAFPDGRTAFPDGQLDARPDARPDGQLDEMDRKVLERLIAAAALRDEAATQDGVAARRVGIAHPIGLSPNGVPLVGVFRGT
jgi:hypothetical protein